MKKASTASGSSTSSVPNTSHTSHGLRSHLGHLLPKHALFQVRLHIDELSNVPLVSGQFGVRWKFKNVQSGSGLLAKMKGHRAPSFNNTITGKNKGKEKEVESEAEMERERDMEPHIAVTTHHFEDHEHPEYQGSDDEDYPVHSSEGGPRPSSTSFSNGSASNAYGQYLTAPSPATPTPSSATPTITKTNSQTSTESRAEARGMTDWVKLQNYNVKWDHTVNVVVQMDVHRESLDLLPNELKLVVMQRVIPGDPDSPQHPRLGAVYLNLAEYADAGAVTRRYLLRDSRTNATLRLTIELEHIAGANNYKPPPLRKGEILAEVSGLLSNNDLVFSQLARELDFFTRSTASNPIDAADDEPARPRHGYPYPFSTSDGHVDFNRLASSGGLRTTESLIESLFNPVPTASKIPSPFTVYAPEQEHASEGDADEWSAGRSSSDNASRVTGDSNGAAPSLYATSSEQSHGNAGHGQDGYKQHWWQKIRSRPGTPGGRQHFLPPTTPRHEVEALPARSALW